MIAFQRKLQTSLVLLCFATVTYSSAVLAALESGCDDIGFDGQPRIQPNTTVDIVFEPSKSAPAAYVTAMNQAIAELSQKIDGIKLQLATVEGTNASIIVNV